MFSDFLEFDLSPEAIAFESALDNLLQGNCDSEQTEDDERFFGVFDWFNCRD
jgi:hypothetical protein